MVMLFEQPSVLLSGRPTPVSASAPQPVASDAKTVANQLVYSLAAMLDAPHTLPQLTEILGRQLGADACLLLWHDQVSESITYTYWYGEEPAQIWQLPTVGSSPQAVLQRQAAVKLIQQSLDVSANPTGLPWLEALSELLEDDYTSVGWLPEMQCQQSMAITAVPKRQGVVLLLSRCCSLPCWVDESSAVNLASVLAIALHQHHLQHQAQCSLEQLRYLNYLKEDFLSTLNHELRTPLTSMMLAIRMLRRPDLTPERAAMYLDILEQQCAREINLVNDLLMLQTVNAGTTQTNLFPVNLVQLLASLTAKVQDALAKAQLTLVLNLPAEPVLIDTSASYLNRAMQELLTNARKYSTPGSTITLTLAQTNPDHPVAVVQLTNVGAGISPDELPHIFERFRRGHNATKNAIPGTGTGLALVRSLIEKVGGTISVSSQPIGEQLWQTCFTLEFPLHRPLTQGS